MKRDEVGLRLTWCGTPYVGPKRRPWWLDQYGELPDWLVVVLMVVLIVGLPAMATAGAATGRPWLLIVAMALVFPLCWFITTYGHDELP